MSVDRVELTDRHDGNLYCRDCGNRIGATGVCRGICEQDGCGLAWQEQIGARRWKPTEDAS